MYNIDVRILGEEYREKDFTGKDIKVHTHLAVLYT